ncbi:MAG: tyrosine protein phosphatase [Chloroflexota bacterium]
MSTIYWIKKQADRHVAGRFAIVTRPRGNEWLADDVRALREQGVNVLVSFLESKEQSELGLTSEPIVAEEMGIRYLNFPIPDFQVPDSLQGTRLFIQQIVQLLDEGRTVGIHCRQSVGRSGLISAAVLVEQGDRAEEAFARVEKARGCSVPDTPEQRQWVERYAKMISRSI